MEFNINTDWVFLLNHNYLNNIKEKLDYENNLIYPHYSQIFNAFNHFNKEDLKVVIIGQDPYHGEKQANGLCFSVEKEVVQPPSLKNILKELNQNYSNNQRTNGDLSDWASQGVLLLNSVLSVRKKFPGSHRHIGWEEFTDNVIKIISKEKSNLVFMLWGNYAKNKEKFIHENNHLVLKSGHPSPLSANKGFWFGNKHFLKCNEFLIEKKIENIKWL